MLSEQILGLDPQEWDDEGCEDDARERSQVPSIEVKVSRRETLWLESGERSHRTRVKYMYNFWDFVNLP